MKPNPRLKKYYLWVCNHAMLFRYLVSIPLCTLYTILFLYAQSSIWIILAANAFILFGSALVPSAYNGKLLILALNELKEQCTPAPLLEETERQLAKAKNEQVKQLLQIDRCVALLYMGEYQTVYDTLCGINIDRFSGMLPAQKLIYYNNLADICTKTDRPEQADAWHQKQLQFYSMIKNKKQKQLLQYSMEEAKAQALYRKQEYTMAIDAFSSLPFKNRLQRVESSMFIARCHLALDHKDEARAALCYVIANGNKTTFPEEAKALLEQL